ncbi:Stk1 family PASTA domain-containing Ser/Thr kinase [Longispora albida]|uniref:Stk1 family PASTA domain-containing Ser/Thr kinase n=1 Tax=Longispora albida TaxID=203523 RepID=UPI00047772C1|nr:Stk1 family PASTA domain-containing Ser/Thr kinase [Longispora albida]
MDTTVADPLIGALLDDRYRIRGRVARGGMATVYHAIDERLERTVAIKIIHATHAGHRQFTEKFEREAKMIARLAHPNIVAVYDEGRHEGLPYLVMEYIRGRTLRDLLTERHRLPAAEALGLMAPVLAALAAAHRSGMVHRDVKPENVLLADDGQIKVADFGLARAVEASGDDHSSGQLLATVAYVAPELVSAGHADPRADVYSAGIMLFELITGRVPYDGDKAVEVAWQHVERDVPPPSAYAPGTPAIVDELIARATRRDPGARPTDAGALLAELTAAREDLVPLRQYPGHQPPPQTSSAATQLIPVVRPPQTVKAKRRPLRRPPLVIAAVLVTIGLIAALGGWWFGAGRYVDTPSLLAMSQDKAMTTAGQAGFRVTSTEKYSETIPAGTVMAQNPEPRKPISRGGTIALTVSKGQERYTLPNELIGMDAAEAVKLLGSMGLKTTQTQQYNEAAAGKVISSDPPAGAVLARGAAVALVVSKGPPPISVPKVTGKKLDEAKAELERLGLVVKVTTQESDQPKDHVVGQSLPSGKGVEPGTEITLTVSTGPAMVVVPDLAGLSFDDAKKSLDAIGLVANRAFNWPGGRNVVYTQSPAASTQVPKGTTISLWLY